MAAYLMTYGCAGLAEHENWAALLMINGSAFGD